MTVNPKITHFQPVVKPEFASLDWYIDIAANHRLILDPKEARDFIEHELPEECALDFETTALSPLVGKVRLTCLFSPKIGAVILDHEFCGEFARHADALAERSYFYVYNSKFETRWFDHAAGDMSFRAMDVDFLAKSFLGGGHSSLAHMAKRDLGLTLDKDLQASDWSQLRLTQNQYTYGALDSVVTWYLRDYWAERCSDAQWNAADVFNDAVRATIEAEETGLFLDTIPHMQNIVAWKRRHRTATAIARRYTPATEIPNLASNKQVSDWLKRTLDQASINAWPKTEKSGQLSLDRDTVMPIAKFAPWPFSRWLIAFTRMRYYEKYLSTYGEKLVTKQVLSGHITSRFNIAQAATGRYSSSDSNLQNIPRKTSVRRAFSVNPRAKQKLVMADYSGIEIRVLAEISQDPQLLADAIAGTVHSGSASAIYKIPFDDFMEVYNNKKHRLYYDYKEKRSKGKGFTFQLTYGAAAPALSVVLSCSIDEAEQAIRAWAQRYPRAYNYRNIIFDQMMQDGFLPVCDGRTIYIRKPDRTLPVAANYGIQGAAASVMCRAMYHVHRLYRERLTKGARIAAPVHDELLTYVPEAQAEQALALLIEGMTIGWLDIFPNTSTENLIEAVIGTTWADKP